MSSLIGRVNVNTNVIIQTQGLISNIRYPYHLCDGTNGTPDLRGKFVKGAPVGVNAGATVGSDNVSIAITNLPTHTHVVSNDSHNHVIGINKSGLEASIVPVGSHLIISSSPPTFTATATTGITVNATGNGSTPTHNNIPQYYEVLFMMKVGGR